MDCVPGGRTNDIRDHDHHAFAFVDIASGLPGLERFEKRLGDESNPGSFVDAAAPCGTACPRLERRVPTDEPVVDEARDGAVM
ncbi:MAG TPA: hypothetical protein VEU08_06245, partial [Vicinamibacterales bacterium]|nr:hypothetical protein [Vicinamibacterales bacterium]